MSNLQPTKITDINGKQTTVHKKPAKQANTGRIRNVASPKLTIPEKAPYVAPNDPALYRQVRLDGEVMTWGKVLEEIQPVGVTRMLIDNVPTWGAVHPENPNISTNIPVAVAKASGLPDVTKPITRAQDDVVLAKIKLEKLYDKAGTLSNSERIEGKIRADLAAQNQVVYDAIVKVDNLKRDQERAIINDLSPEARENLIYAHRPSHYQTEALVDYGIDKNDIELLKKVANHHNRDALGEDHADKLLFHENPSVQVAFIDNNDRISIDELRSISDFNLSPFVVSAADSELSRRSRK